MLFKRLLGRKKQPDSAPEDQEDPIRIIRSGSETGVEARRNACRRTRRLSELREIAASDQDAGVREIALARYRTLLCGLQEDGPDRAERLREIALMDDRHMLQKVAIGGREAELRHAAIVKITDQDVLCTCALKDPLAANRSAAVERLDQEPVLERVVKNIGKKDKLVYRIARSKLKAIAAREAARAQYDELCDRIARLGRSGRWTQDRLALDLLDREWTRTAPAIDQARKDRYQDLRNRFLRACQAHLGEHQARIAEEKDRHALRAEYSTLIQELQTLSTRDDAAALTDDLTRIDACRNRLPRLPDQEERSSLEREYADARKAAADHLKTLAATARNNTRLGELLTRARQVSTRTGPLEQKQIRALMEEAAPLLAAKGSDQAVAADFAQARATLEERLHTQTKRAEKQLALLPEKLDALSGALEQGGLKAAESLHQSIGAALALAVSSGLPRRAYGEAATRLRNLTPKLRELQQWRKWGQDQGRRELCTAMETLGSEDLPPEAMMLRLHDLQMEWKRLDKAGRHPAGHPLWGRFHAASERVYQRCKPYLEEQAAEREANRRLREQLCRTLETFLDQADWERMDWKKAVRAKREMRRAWSAIGHVERRHHKALARRFHAALRRLEQRLAEERSRNLAHKRDLIAQTEALAAEADLDRAIAETKRLQRQWHTTVAARKKEEQQLWQGFRAAGDRVFARLEKQQETHAAELAANLRQHEDLCAEAEALAASDADAEALTARLQALNRRRRDCDIPPRRYETDLSRRWRTARDLVQDRIRERLEAERRRDLDLLARQADLCKQLEQAIAAGDAAEPPTTGVEAEWQALPTQPDAEVQTAIRQRYDQALDALRQGGETRQAFRDALAANGERRARLCLRLEILARIDSPPEFTQDRLRFQVTRLAGHMREGEKDPLDTGFRLLREWYLCGPAPAARAAALEERFLRARKALEAVESGTRQPEETPHAREVPD